MALHIGRKRHASGRRRFWPRRTAGEHSPDGTAKTTEGTVLARRRPQWWRSRQNPVSALILAAGWAAIVVLGIGMLLTWADANPGNSIVDAILDAGRWLATPFHDVFTRQDPEEQLYINWAIAGAVYYVLARGISWLTRL